MDDRIFLYLGDQMPDEIHTGRSREVFFQHISHDIRGAYFGVGSICAIIYEKIASGQEVPLRLAESLMEASRHYKYLLDQFLEFTRSKIATVEEVEWTSFNAVEEIREIVEINHFLAQERRIVVEIKVDGEFPRHMLTDKWKITRIFYNVFVNALKFSPPESRIGIEFSATAEHWLLKVTDQGKGIDPEILQRLFVDRPLAEPEGLGLYITGYLTRLLGGELSVASSAATGTQFAFRFPLLMGERAGQVLKKS